MMDSRYYSHIFLCCRSLVGNPIAAIDVDTFDDLTSLKALYGFGVSVIVFWLRLSLFLRQILERHEPLWVGDEFLPESVWP